jgi:adenylate cyclase
MSVVGAIEPSLRQAEIERAKRKRPDSLDAYDLYLRALPKVSISMPESADKALPLLGKAIQIEPDYAAAHAAIALCHENRYMRGRLLGGDKRAALHQARIAVATGGDDATALAFAAFMIGILEHDYDSAFDAFERALALSPSSAIALSFSAIIHAWAGDYRQRSSRRSNLCASARSVRCCSCPMSVSPMHISTPGVTSKPHSPQTARHKPTRNSLSPGCYVPHRLPISVANGELRASVQRLLELWPGFTIKRFLAGNFTSPERLAMLRKALRRAGIPDE